MSLRVLPTGRPDTWEVQGRGELQLAVLVEMMRREGFELTVGKPQVLVQEIDGRRHEPFERLTVDVPAEHVGTVSQLLETRRGRLEQMVSHDTGWVRLEFCVREGLIGFRGVPTQTRGTGLIPRVRGLSRGRATSAPRNRIPGGRPPGYGHLVRAVRAARNVESFSSHRATRCTRMIVSENPRPEDMDVNPTRRRNSPSGCQQPKNLNGWCRHGSTRSSRPRFCRVDGSPRSRAHAQGQRCRRTNGRRSKQGEGERQVRESGGYPSIGDQSTM